MFKVKLSTVYLYIISILESTYSEVILKHTEYYWYNVVHVKFRCIFLRKGYYFNVKHIIIASKRSSC